MRIGQIVEFCEGHHMKEWFPGKCIVLEKMRNHERYFISTICDQEEDRHLTGYMKKISHLLMRCEILFLNI